MAGLDRKRFKMVYTVRLGWGSQGMLTEFWGTILWKIIIWKMNDDIKIDLKEVEGEDGSGRM